MPIDAPHVSRRHAVGIVAASLAAAVAAPAAGQGRATPMIKMIITIKRREGMSREDFVRHQRGVHMSLLKSIPEARQYLRRFVVSYPIPAPDYPGPSYDSVVEAWFDSMEDMKAFYSSENFRNKVAPDHANFMDLTSYGRIIAEEDIVIE